VPSTHHVPTAQRFQAAVHAQPMAQRDVLEPAAIRLCGDNWDWLVVENVGKPPTLLITKFRGTL
jgi:hypothetical protein